MSRFLTRFLSHAYYILDGSISSMIFARAYISMVRLLTRAFCVGLYSMV